MRLDGHSSRLDFGGVCIRVQDDFGLVIGRVGAAPMMYTPTELKRRWERWLRRNEPRVAVEFHYADHGVAGGWPHSADACADRG